MKIARISLVLLLSGSLFASGAMASVGCGMNPPQAMHSFSESSNLCSACCDSGDAQCSCNAQCSQPVEMPDVVFVSSGSFHSDSYGLTVAPVKVFDGLLYPEGGPNFLFSKKAVVSPPLFLLNKSFMI